MKSIKMSDKYDYTSAKDAHWRIDDLAAVVSDLTSVIDSHSQDLNSIKQTGRAIKSSLYTLAFVIVSSEVGLIEALRKVLGI
jgi:hypothetical protein